MRIAIYAAVIALALLMCGCAEKPHTASPAPYTDIEPTVSQEAESTREAEPMNEKLSEPQAYYGPLTFKSYEELDNARKSGNPEYYAYELEKLDFYYALSPELLKDTGAVLAEIRIKDLYFTQEFCIGKPTELGADVNWDERYSAELSSVLKLVWTRISENAQYRLEKGIENMHMLPLDEKEVYYYNDITSESAEVLLRSIYWIEDGYCFQFDISIDMYNELTGGDTSYETISRITKLKRVELSPSGLTGETEPFGGTDSGPEPPMPEP